MLSLLFPLLIIIFLSKITDSCLVVNFPTTTTTPGPCNCQFLSLTKENLGTVRLNPFRNISSSAIGTPITSGDECSREASCPAGYEIAAFDEKKVKLWGSSELSAFCDGRQWLIDDGRSEIQSFTQLYVACISFTSPKCPCVYGDSTDPEVSVMIDQNPDVQFMKSLVAQFRPPFWYYSIDKCPVYMDCGKYWIKRLYLSGTSTTTLSQPELECDTTSRTWRTSNGELTELYAVCMEWLFNHLEWVTTTKAIP